MSKYLQNLLKYTIETHRNYWNNPLFKFKGLWKTFSISDGKSMAMSRDAKFIETSSGIQHNVDELLVGVLKQVCTEWIQNELIRNWWISIEHKRNTNFLPIQQQIRLKEKREKKTSGGTGRMKTSRTHISLHMAKEILQKICFSDITKSRSCENLHVL